MFTDPLHIYTDGSYMAKTRTQSYGWVLTNPSTPSMETCRVVTSSVDGPVFCRGSAASNHMEAAAIVDALCEFAYRGRHIIIHADSQTLPALLSKYQAGEATTDVFLNNPNVMTEAMGRRLLAVLPLVSFEIVWVKGHGNDFGNLVIDQALRLACIDQLGDKPAVAFARAALAEGEAIIWGKCYTYKGQSREYFNGPKLVKRRADGTAVGKPVVPDAVAA